MVVAIVCCVRSYVVVFLCSFLSHVKLCVFIPPAEQEDEEEEEEEEEDEDDICLICGKDGDGGKILHCCECPGGGSGIGVYHSSCVKAPPNTNESEVCKSLAPFRLLRFVAFLFTTALLLRGILGAHRSKGRKHSEAKRGCHSSPGSVDPHRRASCTKRQFVAVCVCMCLG